MRGSRCAGATLELVLVAGGDAAGGEPRYSPKAERAVVLCVLRSYAGSRFVWGICMGEREEVGERAAPPFYYGRVIEWARGEERGRAGLPMPMPKPTPTPTPSCHPPARGTTHHTHHTHTHPHTERPTGRYSYLYIGAPQTGPCTHTCPQSNHAYCAPAHHVHSMRTSSPLPTPYRTSLSLRTTHARNPTQHTRKAHPPSGLVCASECRGSGAPPRSCPLHLVPSQCSLFVCCCSFLPCGPRCYYHHIAPSS